MNLTTPQEVFNHIISIYEECETLEEIDKISSHYICNAIEFLEINQDLSNKCIEVVVSNFNLVDSDLLCTRFVLLNPTDAVQQHRQKEYIQIKIDYLKQLIELCDKEKI